MDMGDEIASAIKLFVDNEDELNMALVKAGGGNGLVREYLDRPLRDFLVTLARNSVVLEATYSPARNAMDELSPQPQVRRTKGG